MGWGGFLYPWAGNNGQPAAFETASSPAIVGLLQDPGAQYDFVLEGRPWRTSNVDESFPAPWGAFPWAFGGDGNIGRVRYSYRGLVTSDTDAPANTYMPATLSDPVNWQQSIPVSGEPGQAAASFGAVTFAATVDDDVSGYWNGRVFTVKLGGRFLVGQPGETPLNYSEYLTRWTMRGQHIEHDDETATLYARDRLTALQGPIASDAHIYDGTDQYQGNGEVDIAGQRAPILLGRVFNISPVLVNSTSNIYQIHSMAAGGALMSAITDVRVNGASLTNAGDTNDLPAWTGGSATQYKTDLARGLIRLWAAPDGKVTADAGMSNQAAGTVLRGATFYGGYFDRDFGSFDAFPDWEIGYYVKAGTSESTIDVMHRLAGACDGWVTTDREGNILVDTHQNINITTPVAEIEGRTDQGGPCVVVALRRIAAPPPPRSVAVAYRKNWTVQSEDGLDSTLTEAEKLDYSKPYSITETAYNYRATDYYPDAPDLVMDAGYLWLESDAITLRDQIIERVGAARQMFEVEITAPMYQLRCGDIVRVYYDHFGLQNGALAEVITMVENAQTTTLQVITQ